MNLAAVTEEIIYQFPVLKLADVYAIITYYLRNRDTVQKYLNDRMQLAV
jgi:uncharacterized protein (DUF433 family)